MTVVDAWKQNRVRLGRNSTEYVPTWTTGQEQSAPQGIKTYAEVGYHKNSLIYSCISEKATSFAPLQAQVVRANGTVAERHKMVTLLNDPNTHQDGQDFAEFMATHFEVAGNVYIKKIQQSRNAQRRQQMALYPVQELEIIRPDYVSITPGPSRDSDVFVVTVGGQVVERIPRRNMIHIHEPSMINDFYGDAKLSRLVREGSIDLNMSDFELSFFRNAGVPMGLLNIKGRTTQEQTDEIKSRFRNAFVGIRKWFDVLVLNADETSYQQLGLKQVDMEMADTRAQAESRICSVFGVPGKIVGALYAMADGTTYEDAEHAFWAETMVPFSLRFARAFQKFLLPDFAVGADAGAMVTYDFRTIRALQEDRSRKFREIVRMVNTGAFTVNQALTLNGLPAIAGADWYLRSANMSEVAEWTEGEREVFTTQQPDTGAVAEPDNPLEGAAMIQAAVQEAERLTIWRNGTH